MVADDRLNFSLHKLIIYNVNDLQIRPNNSASVFADPHYFLPVLIIHIVPPQNEVIAKYTLYVRGVESMEDDWINIEIVQKSEEI